jgi:hypothetical protein
MIYIVTMLRNGDRESHHYCIGAYTDLAKAYIEAAEHKLFRGNKYEPLIQECVVDGEHLKEVPINVCLSYAKLKNPDRFDAYNNIVEKHEPPTEEVK